jgi:PKD repeat protein
LRSRQTPQDTKESSSKQRQNQIAKENSKIVGLDKIPVPLFEENTSGEGLLGSAKLKARPNLQIPFTDSINSQGKPHLQEVSKFSYFFIKFDNPNGIGVASLVKNFVVIKTLSAMSTVDFSQMSGYSISSISSLTENDYNTGSFTHPKYLNSKGEPLPIRYAEISILRQVTPGRLDDTPIGYPNFDSTPNTVIGKKGPLASPPRTSFTSSTGATSTITVTPGSSVEFKDTTPFLPFNSGPTGWDWYFGSGASPTGSTSQNPSTVYGATGVYSVTLTASNSSGSTPFTISNFINVTF